MILTHGANSLNRGVEIGGRRYPVVKIGNQLWMAENLDWKWTNLTVGGSYVNDGNPHAWYYNNDESTYGANGNKYGLLYNTAAMEELVNGQIELPANWRVPTYNDFNILYTLVGSNNAAKLKSVDGWISGNGTDDYGFNGKPTGAIVVTASPYSPAGVGEYANFYSQTEYSSTRQYGMWLYYNSPNIDLPGAYVSKGNAMSIRLVKDAT